jgi:hypothetical protein
MLQWAAVEGMGKVLSSASGGHHSIHNIACNVAWIWFIDLHCSFVVLHRF